MSESVEEFIARGGKVEQVKSGGKQTATASQLTKKDARLATLRQLLKDIDGDQDAELRVDRAIYERVQLLKSM